MNMTEREATQKFIDEDATAEQMADWEFDQLPDFVKGYIECAFWTADPAPGSGEYSLDYDDWSNLLTDSKVALIKDAEAFDIGCGKLIDEAIAIAVEKGEPRNYDNRHAGHDAYLSIHGHGSGFLDRGNEPIWTELQNKARAYHASELHFCCTNSGDCNGPGNCDACDDKRGIYEAL
jgi:hypothetical protein